MTGIYTVTRRPSTWPTDTGATKFFIYTKERIPPFYTFNALLASLAQRSYELGHRIRVGSRQTKHGEQIVTIDILAPAQAEGVAS